MKAALIERVTIDGLGRTLGALFSQRCPPLLFCRDSSAGCRDCAAGAATGACCGRRSRIHNGHDDRAGRKWGSLKKNQLPSFLSKTRSGVPQREQQTNYQKMPTTHRRRTSTSSSSSSGATSLDKLRQDYLHSEPQHAMMDYVRPRRRSSSRNRQEVVVVFHTVPRQRRRRSRSGSRSRSRSRSSSRSRAAAARRRPSYVKVPGMTKALRIGRPSPIYSATLFPEYTPKRGQDGNEWEVRINSAGVKQWRRV